jgi:rfaE bifunctional protein kinase chain/domain
VKTVFISGNFNILHPGHQRLIKFANDLGDNLIVGVNSDFIAGDQAFISEEYRLEGIKNNVWVSEAHLLETQIEEYLEILKPDIVVKGKEWENQKNREKKVLDKYGGRLIFTSGGPVFSSIELLSKNNNSNEPFSNNSFFPSHFAKRHNFTKKNLLDCLDKFKGLNICVIGDLIIDEYISCTPLGMSQEDPTIVVSPTEKARFIGGAGIVSMHASSLGARVTFLSVTGKDEERKYAKDQLNNNNLTAYLAVDEKRNTTLKQRFQAEGKVLLRVSNLIQDSIDKAIQSELLEAFDNVLDDIDLVVFSDFNYGCLPQTLVDKIISKSKKSGKLIFADSQSSSQVGDICRFKHMDFISATEREARISLQNSQDGLVVLAEKLKSRSEASNIFLKLGAQGVLLYLQSNKGSDKFITDRLLALNNSPKDISGAGDAMLITAALTFAVEKNPFIAACMGNIASAIQVGRMGNIPLSLEEFHKVLSN